MLSKLSSKTLPLGVLCAALLAVGCSGSGDSPTEPGGLSDAEVEFQSFRMANTAREQEGVDPQLGLENPVSAVARAHSEAMRDQGFFGHNDPTGQNVADRLRAAGVGFRSVAENLVRVNAGANPAGVAHDLLMGSEEHRTNILSPKYRLAGVGVARSGDTYWVTQIFIKP